MKNQSAYHQRNNHQSQKEKHQHRNISIGGITSEKHQQQQKWRRGIRKINRSK